MFLLCSVLEVSPWGGKKMLPYKMSAELVKYCATLWSMPTSFWAETSPAPCCGYGKSKLLWLFIASALRLPSVASLFLLMSYQLNEVKCYSHQKLDSHSAAQLVSYLSRLPPTNGGKSLRLFMRVVCSGAIALVFKADNKICNNGVFGGVSVSELQLMLCLKSWSFSCICRKLNRRCLIFVGTES